MTRPDPYFPSHGDPTFGVEHYDLDLSYRPIGNRIDGHASITALAEQVLNSFEFDLGPFTVTGVSLDGRKVRYRHRNGRLRVSPAVPIEAGTRFSVAISYRGSPAPIDGVLGGAGWEELSDGVIVAAQPYGAPSWFPCNDRPDDKAGYRFTITAPTGYYVLANGALIQTRRGASGSTWVYQQDEPMAPYLASVNIGRYAIHRLSAVVPIAVLVPGTEHLELPGPFARQPAMMATFTDLFGPYPFSGYTVVVTDDDLEIPLESQGLSVFGRNFLTEDWGSERLVAHELAHQWFGNAVTAGGWDDIWLHEGFACYAEWLWSEFSNRESASVHARKHWQRLASLPQDLRLSDPGPVEMFDDRVYKRGALLLHALRGELGDQDFFALLRTWVERFGYRTAQTTDFRELAEEIGGRDLSALFGAWLEELTLPELTPRS